MNIWKIVYFIFINFGGGIILFYIKCFKKLQIMILNLKRFLLKKIDQQKNYYNSQNNRHHIERIQLIMKIWFHILITI